MLLYIALYVGEKVGVGNVCLWCNERGHAFYSLRAVRTHMKDKGHCKMLTDGDAALEYADFYDFRSGHILYCYILEIHVQSCMQSQLSRL